METDTVTIEQFLKTHGITMTCERVGVNPNMLDSRDMDHWKCVLKMRGHGRMTTYFSMGYGHNGKAPEAAEVLSCLASDSASVDNNDFESWCGDFGYDTDSRKAEKTYKACEHAAKRLKNWLGADAYNGLLYHVEWL